MENTKSQPRPIPSSRGARTRIALLDAGRKLFAAHPADAVAIDDIVTEASVAKGSFYNHFTDKEALLAAIVADIRAGIEERILFANASVTDPAARVVRAICVYAAVVNDRPADGHILLRNDPRGSVSQPLNEGLRRDLTEGLRQGRLLVPSMDAGLLFVIGAAHSALLRAVRRQDGAKSILEVQQLCMLMLRGFGLSHGESELIAAQAADDIIRLRTFET